MEKKINTRICTKSDSLSNWTTQNPILLNNEEALVVQTDGSHRRKIGDGSTHFNDLPYYETSIIQAANDYADSLLGGEQFNDKYSEAEIVVGQWIDQRPIYRRTLVMGGDKFTSTANWVRHYFTTDEQNQMNLDFFINIKGMAKCTSTSATATGSWQPIPRICPDAVAQFSIGVGDLNATQVGVLFGSSYTGADPVYLVLDYVKK